MSNPTNKVSELPSEDEKIQEARKVFKEVIAELGFANHKPYEMSNSDYWMCTSNAMIRYAEKAIAYEQWKAGVFAEWMVTAIELGYNHKEKHFFYLNDPTPHKLTTTELMNCEDFKQYLEKRRKEEGK